MAAAPPPWLGVPAPQAGAQLPEPSADAFQTVGPGAAVQTYASSEQPLVLIPLVRRGDRAGIEQKLQGGANVHETDVEGNTPLHVAAQAPKNEVAVVQALLAAGANVNAVNYIGAAPLHYVCLREKNHKSMASLLLESQAEMDRATTAGKTPLHFACEKLVEELVEVFCQVPANTNLQDVEGNTPMHLALRSQGRDTVHMKILEQLTRCACPAQVHIPNLQGFLPIHIACQAGAAHCVQLLMQWRELVQAATSTKQQTCLQLSCQGNHPDVTQLILSTVPPKSHIDAADIEGNTAIHHCALVGSFDCAACLLQAAADINLKNGQKRTPLDIARVKGGADLSTVHNDHLVQLLKDGKSGGGCRQS